MEESLYEIDYYLWLETQIGLFKNIAYEKHYNEELLSKFETLKVTLEEILEKLIIDLKIIKLQWQLVEGFQTDDNYENIKIKSERLKDFLIHNRTMFKDAKFILEHCNEKVLHLFKEITGMDIEFNDALNVFNIDNLIEWK